MKITKEEYFKAKEDFKNKQAILSEEFFELREKYIEHNKPCRIDQRVIITSAGGRKIEGLARGFSLNASGTIFVNSVKPDKGPMIYLSVAPLKTVVV